MDNSGLLGSVEVEVRANLDKLIADFAKARGQTKHFDAQMAQFTRGIKDNFDASSKLESEYRSLARSLDPLTSAATRYGDQLVRISRLQKTGFLDDNMARRWSANARKQFDDVAAGMAKTGRAANGLTGIIGPARIALGGLAAVLGIHSVQSFASFVTKTLESTAAIKDMAAQVGLTTTALQTWRGASKDLGMSAEEMDGALKEFNQTVRQAAGGLERPKKLFDLLGISINDAEGNLRPMDELLLETVDRLGKVGNEAERAAGQAVAFGEAYGPKMAQAVAMGSEKINELRAAVAATGMVLSDEQIQKADETAKKLGQVKMVLQAKIAAAIVENADAISTLADVIGRLATVALQGMASIPRFFNVLNDALDGHVGKALKAIPVLGSLISMLHALSDGPTVTVSGVATGSAAGALAGAAIAGPKPKGGGISLAGLLAPKGPKGRTGRKGGGREVENQYDRELLREQERQLRLEKDRTGNLVRENEIDKQLIDLDLQQRAEQIDQMVSRKALTATQAKKLKLDAETTAAMEKEVADRRMRVAQIEASNRAAGELAALEQDALDLLLSMARTDRERRVLELAILDLKQQQAVSEIDKQIALAREADDETRIADLTEQRRKLLENNLKEIKAFDLEHMSEMEKFRNALPRTTDEFNEAIRDLKFELFNEKLQQAAVFADDIGSAFGRAAGALARFESPLDVLQGLLGDLSQTLTREFIEKPITEWATNRIGLPAAKQGFGKDLAALGGLDTQQLNIALAQATGSVAAMNAAAGTAGPVLTSVASAAAPIPPTFAAVTAAASALTAALTAAAAAAGGQAGGDFLSALLDIGGAAAGGGGDFGFLVPAGLEGAYPGFAGGGFTGGGRDNEIAGLVHRNEYVFDAPTTRRMRPLLSMIDSGRVPSFTSSRQPGGRGGDTHFHMGQMVFPGVTDGRSARRTGQQAAGQIHRKIARVAQKGVSTSQ